MTASTTRLDRVVPSHRVEASLSAESVLVAEFVARLAATSSPLDRITTEELEDIRREFSKLPEVAGEPLPVPKAVRER